MAACGGGGDDKPAEPGLETSTVQLSALQVEPVNVKLRSNDPLVLKGAGFVENMRITVKSVSVSEMKWLSPNQVSFHLPELHIASQHRAELEIHRGDNQRTSINVELVPTVKAESVTPLQAHAGARLTVRGQHLNLIKSVQFGDRAARYQASLDGRLLEVTVPPGAPSGAITATDNYGFTYTLTGSFSVQAESIEIEALDYGQSHLRPAAEQFDLTPGKPAIIRAKVSSTTPGSVGNVKLKVDYAPGESHTYEMKGPAHIPLKSGIRADDLRTFYTYVLKGDQIKPGMRLTVEAAASDKHASSTFSPRVVAPTRIHVHLVPVMLLGKTGALETGKASKLMNGDALKRQLEAMFPISEIAITTQANPVIAGHFRGDHYTNRILTGLINGEESQLPPDQYFMGILPGNGEEVVMENGDTGMLLGLADPGGRYSVVWDDTGNLVVNAAHELAHNLGRRHSFEDQYFPDVPYKNGIGANWGINLTSAPFQLYDPKSHYDLMSYNFPTWISTYTYDHLGKYATQNLSASPAMLAYTPDRQASRTPVVSIAGLISNDRVWLSYSHHKHGQINFAPVPPTDAMSGSGYSIEITLSNGAIATYPLKLRQLSDRRAEPTSIFDLSIADSGGLKTIRVKHGARMIFEERVKSQVR
ncbi:hypothetical protein WM23_22320 [Burkholderia ubonensis]|nr:hypothetical protein WM23_22320 [Burkholderia ubonensis]